MIGWQEVAMIELKIAFRNAFKEGLQVFFSPFFALVESVGSRLSAFGLGRDDKS